MMFQEVKVAAISFVPEKFELGRNADRLEGMFRKAAEGGTQLAVAPEGVLEGYVVNEIIGGEVPAARMREVAVSLRSGVIGRFKALAKELEMCLAFGLAEKIGKDVFNCAVFIDQRGRICGKYHKMQLAEGYHASWWYNRLGKVSRAFHTPFGRCGFLICNDRWNPDIARIPVLDGARYLLIPSFGSRSKSQDENVLARARENGVPIVEANVGVTMIVNKGEVVARSRRETTVTFGSIEVPAPPSRENRDQHERGFLKWRKKEMRVRFQERMARVRGNQVKGRKVREKPWEV